MPIYTGLKIASLEKTTQKSGMKMFSKVWPTAKRGMLVMVKYIYERDGEIKLHNMYKIFTSFCWVVLCRISNIPNIYIDQCICNLGFIWLFLCIYQIKWRILYGRSRDINLLIISILWSSKIHSKLVMSKVCKQNTPSLLIWFQLNSLTNLIMNVGVG